MLRKEKHLILRLLKVYFLQESKRFVCPNCYTCDSCKQKFERDPRCQPGKRMYIRSINQSDWGLEKNWSLNDKSGEVKVKFKIYSLKICFILLFLY